jgi:aspartate/tyrosine/aromatic aminotransferase
VQPKIWVRQWRSLPMLTVKKGLIRFVALANRGLGSGSDDDAQAAGGRL